MALGIARDEIESVILEITSTFDLSRTKWIHARIGRVDPINWRWYAEGGIGIISGCAVWTMESKGRPVRGKRVCFGSKPNELALHWGLSIGVVKLGRVIDTSRLDPCIRIIQDGARAERSSMRRNTAGVERVAGVRKGRVAT